MKKTILILSFVIYCFTTICSAQNSKHENKLNTSMFRGNPQHTGVYNSKASKEFHAVKWTFKAEGRIFSSPIIFEKKLYFGGDDFYIYCLEKETGKLVWKFKTGGAVNGSPTVFDGKLYIGSYDGNFYCLNAKNGKEIWHFKTAGEKQFAAPGIHGLPEKDRALSDPWDMYLSSPVVCNNKVLFGCGEGTFYALNTENGKEIWKFKTNGVIHSSPAIYENAVYFGSWDSYFYALNVDNGKEIWKFKSGIDTVSYNQQGFQSSPAISNGVVYTGCRDANVYALDAKTGELKWKTFNNYSWVISSPAILGDTVYYTTSDTHKLVALNAKDGKELFVGDVKTFGFSSPSIAGGILYTGSYGGSLFAFCAKTGKLQWEYKTPAAKENKLKLLTENGEFDFGQIFKNQTYKGMCEAVDLMYALGSILSSPSIENGIIYFTTTDGNVYALEK